MPQRYNSRAVVLGVWVQCTLQRLQYFSEDLRSLLRYVHEETSENTKWNFNRWWRIYLPPFVHLNFFGSGSYYAFRGLKMILVSYLTAFLACLGVPTSAYALQRTISFGNRAGVASPEKLNCNN